MSGAEGVRLMTDVGWLILSGFFLIMVAICLIIVIYLDYQVSKLRKENNLLHRVLEDYFKLENGRIRAAQAMLCETGCANWPPSGW